MKMPRQQLRHRNHRRRKQRTQEEALQAHRHRTHIELGDEPEQQLQRHRNGQVDRDRELLADAGRHEAQHHPPHRDAEPEARGDEARAEGGPVPDVDHERDDPAAQRDLDADVEQQEERAQPGDAGVRDARDGLLHPVARVLRGAGVGGTEGGAGSGPEGEDGGEEFDCGAPNLEHTMS